MFATGMWVIMISVLKGNRGSIDHLPTVTQQNTKVGALISHPCFEPIVRQTKNTQSQFPCVICSLNFTSQVLLIYSIPSICYTCSHR